MCTLQCSRSFPLSRNSTKRNSPRHARAVFVARSDFSRSFPRVYYNNNVPRRRQRNGDLTHGTTRFNNIREIPFLPAARHGIRRAISEYFNGGGAVSNGTHGPGCVQPFFGECESLFFFFLKRTHDCVGQTLKPTSN